MKNKLFLWKFSGEEAADLHNPSSAATGRDSRPSMLKRTAGGLREQDAGSSAAQGGSESTWTDYKETLHAGNPPALPSPPYLHSQTPTHTCITPAHTQVQWGTNTETTVLCSQYLNTGKCRHRQTDRQFSHQSFSLFS